MTGRYEGRVEDRYDRKRPGWMIHWAAKAVSKIWMDGTPEHSDPANESTGKSDSVSEPRQASHALIDIDSPLRCPTRINPSLSIASRLFVSGSPASVVPFFLHSQVPASDRKDKSCMSLVVYASSHFTSCVSSSASTRHQYQGSGVLISYLIARSTSQKILLAFFPLAQFVRLPDPVWPAHVFDL